jgi:hypothetical protein
MAALLGERNNATVKTAILMLMGLAVLLAQEVAWGDRGASRTRDRAATNEAVARDEHGKTPYDYVNPFIGTDGEGHTYPGATVPFGMVQLSPDTDVRFFRESFPWCAEKYKQVEDIAGLIGQYAHGNEPSQHIAYLYAYAGMPWRTQERIQQIMQNLFDDTPDGICGNEDSGISTFKPPFSTGSRTARATSVTRTSSKAGPSFLTWDPSPTRIGRRHPRTPRTR